ncbi:MAG: hypothetical protein PHV32_11175 [Eubacteriales bacterium]|nr:hypothetical protein [Eubacteriales bacterium]
MNSPYFNCPWMRQSTTVNPQQIPGLFGPQYMQQPGMFQPSMMQPSMMQPSMMQQQYYQMQMPQGMFGEPDMGDIGSMTAAPGDPPPILSNNPATVSLTIFKELTGYPNYGNPSRNADILYTGNRGAWTFDSPAFLIVPGNQRARLVIRAVLDDHTSVPVNRYSARITVNGTVVHNGRVNLEHGTPSGGMFTNWRELSFNITNLRRNNRIVIENTSNTGTNDWIGIDWMEIRIIPR